MPKVKVQCDVEVGPTQLAELFMQLSGAEQVAFWSSLNHRMQYASTCDVFRFLSSCATSYERTNALIGSRRLAAEAER